MGSETQNHMSAVGVLGKLNPLLAEEICMFSQKWNKRTKSNSSPWPVDGTFDTNQCKEMEILIKNHKPKDKKTETFTKERERVVHFGVVSKTGEKAKRGCKNSCPKNVGRTPGRGSR